MFGSANVIAAPAGRLLVHLGRRYREDHYVREIARSTGLGAGPVSESLRLLADGGHLVRAERGRNVYYRANLGSGLVRILKVAATLAELDELLRELAPGVRSVMLFGSCATGEDTPESDVDLCIVADDPEPVDTALARYPQAGGRPVSAIVLNPDEYLALGQRDPALAERIQRGLVARETGRAV
jgi:DNA-binding transcriptional ArsR family regulator